MIVTALSRAADRDADAGTRAEIAATVSLSPKTIETYRVRLMKKLRVNSVAELVKFAIEHGLTPST